jgi:hypothetical protein
LVVRFNKIHLIDRLEKPLCRTNLLLLSLLAITLHRFFSLQQMIIKLDEGTVQRISSGQLILDVLTTIKELIENAIDANSTQITLTLEDDGLTSISVHLSSYKNDVVSGQWHRNTTR